MYVHASSGQDSSESQGEGLYRFEDISQWSYKLRYCYSLAEIDIFIIC